MRKRNQYTRVTRRRIAVAGALTALAVMLLGVLPSAATHGPPSPAVHPTLLASASFTDAVDAQFRVKLDGQKTQVVNVQEPSEVRTMRIVLDPGARIGWHTHPGPVIVSVAEGELTYVNADDCVARPYGVGAAFIDPGQGNVHAAYNSADVETVLFATFLGVEGPPTVPVAAPADCDPFPS